MKPFRFPKPKLSRRDWILCLGLLALVWISVPRLPSEQAASPIAKTQDKAVRVVHHAKSSAGQLAHFIADLRH